ncbi:MAG: hemerythrin domain-containing protein [Deltaproteobacteria bacterium]|nr:hemerythrin domain-containing protein [Deltaproteobacteria bacterium]
MTQPSGLRPIETQALDEVLEQHRAVRTLIMQLRKVEDTAEVCAMFEQLVPFLSAHLELEEATLFTKHTDPALVEALAAQDRTVETLRAEHQLLRQSVLSISAQLAGGIPLAVIRPELDAFLDLLRQHEAVETDALSHVGTIRRTIRDETLRASN